MIQNAYIVNGVRTPIGNFGGTLAPVRADDLAALVLRKLAEKNQGVDLTAIGDVIMTTGVVRELKRRYGADANIDIATDFAEPFRNNPNIRNIFPVDQVPDVKDRWDLYYNLDNAYELNPTEHYVKNYFYRVFGDINLNRSVELFPTDEDKIIVDIKIFGRFNSVTLSYSQISKI